MRAISIDRARGPLALGATATAALLVVALLSGAPAAGRGNHRADRRQRTVRVSISKFAFHPRTLRVRRGTRVVFANADSTTHTATRPGSFDTGRIRPGHSVAVRLRHRGVYAFHCKIHPFMRGKIVVR